jgi:hypothetical protein
VAVLAVAQLGHKLAVLELQTKALMVVQVIAHHLLVQVVVGLVL